MKLNTQSLPERINELFESASEVDDSLIQWFVQCVRENCIQTSQRIRSGTTALVATWVILWAIANGFVQQGRISSFEFTNLESLLVFGPVIIGILSYNIYSALVSNAFYNKTLRLLIKHTCKKAYELNLDDYLLPSTIFNTENIALQRGNIPGWLDIIQFFWAALFLIFILMSSLIIFAHVSYLMFVTPKSYLIPKITSTLIGLIFWLIMIFQLLI